MVAVFNFTATGPAADSPWLVAQPSGAQTIEQGLTTQAVVLGKEPNLPTAIIVCCLFVKQAGLNIDGTELCFVKELFAVELYYRIKPPSPNGLNWPPGA